MKSEETCYRNVKVYRQFSLKYVEKIFLVSGIFFFRSAENVLLNLQKMFFEFCRKSCLVFPSIAKWPKQLMLDTWYYRYYWFDWVLFFLYILVLNCFANASVVFSKCHVLRIITRLKIVYDIFNHLNFEWKEDFNSVHLLIIFHGTSTSEDYY